MKNNKLKYLVITLLLFVVYAVVTLLIPIPKKDVSVFWLSWSFGALSILLQPVIAFFVVGDIKTLKSKIYGWPIVRLGYIYLFTSLILTLTIFVVGAFVAIPLWILIILMVCILVFFVIGLITTSTYKEEIIKMEEHAPTTTKFINDLRVDSRMLLNKIKDKEAKEKYSTFVDEVQYSDPVSNKNLADLEDEINRKYIEFKDDILNDNYEDVISKIDNLIMLIKERNLRTKQSKE